MIPNNFDMIITFTGFLLISLIIYGFCLHKEIFSASGRGRYVFLPFLLITEAGMLFLSFFFNGYYDFVVTPVRGEFIFPLIGAIIIYAASLNRLLRRFDFFTLLLVTLSIGIFMPADFIIYHPILPLWINPLITAVLWAAFAYGWHYLNGLDGIMPLNGLSFCLGLMCLGWLGGIPMLTACQSAVLGGCTLAFMIFNQYPAKLKLSSGDCSVWGFLAGFLFFESFAEKSGASVYIFSLFMIGTILYAFAFMLFHLNFSGLATHTAYYRANASGLVPSLIYRQIIKDNIFLLILGCFQLYAPNFYSVPLFATAFILWYLYRLENWEINNTSLKEINQDVVQELKKNIQKISSPGKKKD